MNNLSNLTYKLSSLSITMLLTQGWGKAVPIPKNPVYVPPELKERASSSTSSGMPFNAQLHESDLKRGYKVPNPLPKPPQLLNANNSQDTSHDHEEFLAVFARSKVIVTQPNDREMLDKIHKTIEYLLREGPVFEAILIAREGKNPAYSFLYNNQSLEHVYYRWKLYSLLHGEDPYLWRTEEFQMFHGGPMWKPPPLNPYAEGMPQDLIDKAIIDFESITTPKAPPKSQTLTDTSLKSFLKDEDPHRVKGRLTKRLQEKLGDMLANLVPTKAQVGSAMLFCINYADAANDIIERIFKSLCEIESPTRKKLATLFLVSDILHNSSAAVTNASYYRKGFQAKLISIFKWLRKYLLNIDDCYIADRFKQKALVVLGAWKEWTLYEDEFLIQLSNILLGLDQEDKSSDQDQPELEVIKLEPLESATKSKSAENELDGVPVDDAELASCLEAKGLSLRWYRTLELSDNEDEVDGVPLEKNPPDEQNPAESNNQSIKRNKQGLSEIVRFKSSKWETVDPVEVIEQVVTISKLDSMARAESESPAISE